MSVESLTDTFQRLDTDDVGELKQIIKELLVVNAELRRTNVELAADANARVTGLVSADLDSKLEEHLSLFADEVWSAIPTHCSEKTFKNALELALQEGGYDASAEKKLLVMFRGTEVGFVRCDFYVSNGTFARTLEVKKGKMDPKHELQARCYARTAGHPVAYLIHFDDDGATVRRVDA